MHQHNSSHPSNRLHQYIHIDRYLAALFRRWYDRRKRVGAVLPTPHEVWSADERTRYQKQYTHRPSRHATYRTSSAPTDMATSRKNTPGGNNSMTVARADGGMYTQSAIWFPYTPITTYNASTSNDQVHNTTAYTSHCSP